MSVLLALCFFACSIVIWWNVYQIAQDKSVAGVSLVPTYVFITTNVVEVFYFWDLLDFWSVAGAASMAVGNVVWLSLAYHYRRHALYYL